MKKNKPIRNLILSGIFIALSVLLPIVFHAIPKGGNMFLPMHLPVMVAAFFLPPVYACAVGIISPLLSSFITGMPPMAPIPVAIIMTFELFAYALVISLLRKIVYKYRKNLLSPLIALIPAMVLGRVVAGLVMFLLVTLFGVNGPAPVAYVWGAVVTGVPGIIVQLIIIPLLYRILIRTAPGWFED